MLCDRLGYRAWAALAGPLTTWVARDASICGLGQTAVGAAQSAVRLGLIGGAGNGGAAIGGNGKGPA
jgi:hypothetical protein